MEDLGARARSRERVVGALALSASLSLLGCAFFDLLAPGERRLAFSHRQHVEVERMECEVCHENAWVGEDPGMPSADSCGVCHDAMDAERAPERRISTLFAEGRFVASSVSALDEELVFSHLQHASGSMDCGDCHEGIEHSERVGDGQALSMAGCLSCHAERGAGQDCEVCHTIVGQEVAPDSHHHNWMRAHGSVVRSGCTRTADDCQLCHGESTCTACHLEEPPLDHNNFFRGRGHGLRAQMDRNRCATCHRSDSCERCHRETLPTNHTGLWGGTLNTHCLSCHLPLSSQGCSTCHLGTPSHSLGTPKPPDHNAAMNCRQCHGLSAPLPHVDNGSNCNLCHA